MLRHCLSWKFVFKESVNNSRDVSRIGKRGGCRYDEAGNRKVKWFGGFVHRTGAKVVCALANLVNGVAPLRRHP